MPRRNRRKQAPFKKRSGKTRDWRVKTRIKLLVAYPACEKMFAEIVQDLQRKMPPGRRSLLRYTRQQQVQVNRRVFFADFYFQSVNLIIEIDGAQHEFPDNIAKDARRTTLIQSIGIRVRRLTNEFIRTSHQDLIESKILEFLVEQMPEAKQAAITSEYVASKAVKSFGDS